MKSLLIPAVALGVVLSGASFAQSSMNASSQPAAPLVSQQGSPANQDGALNAQKLKQDLQNSGFTDVNVAPESFLVQAKTKDGKPVMMAIGPNGFTAVEAIDRNAPASTESTHRSNSATSNGQK